MKTSPDTVKMSLEIRIVCRGGKCTHMEDGCIDIRVVTVDRSKIIHKTPNAGEIVEFFEDDCKLSGNRPHSEDVPYII